MGVLQTCCAPFTIVHFLFSFTALTDIAPPAQLDVSLEIKIGAYQKQCREKLGPSMWRLDSAIRFVNLQGTIDNAVQGELSKAKNAVYVRPDACFYCKRTKSTKQRDYQKVTASNISAIIGGSWSSYCRAQANRTTLSEPFELMLIAFVSQPASTLHRMHRATKARIVSASQAVRAFVAENDVPGHVGEISQRYWTISCARHPDDTPVSVPINRTFHQIQVLDALRRESQSQPDPIGQNSHKAGDLSDFRPIRIRGIGDGVTTLQISLSDLRSTLGLPNHNLLAHGIFRSLPDEITVPEDQEDIDHIDENDSPYDSESL